ncbi:hypothetical protein [Bacteroides helcogenes]|uniref:PepSY domain-containing protein n=1 Tax=Bacteroides helcogenes (strain ATCC 35417 / DSM 20613 / JCM 6297 / CCUG 15421 / P 36-108) TaxID=693979 RepID=E6SU72_BACT6|nr:hypothetical protein [Bacteroides helcogenes]ADV44345.1 hypothetical protein Bache_2377 [Bacteroides helcogenes P 36-108]MDY5238246.1 hypothetical protein [Bacteroides helcogenes]
MKKTLVALAMIMGLGSSVVFAQEGCNKTSVETAQSSQDEFTKIETKDIPQVILESLGKNYEGAVIKEAFVSERETVKIYKVVLTITKEDQSTDEVTVLLNEKGESVEG